MRDKRTLCVALLCSHLILAEAPPQMQVFEPSAICKSQQKCATGAIRGESVSALRALGFRQGESVLLGLEPFFSAPLKLTVDSSASDEQTLKLSATIHDALPGHLRLDVGPDWVQGVVKQGFTLIQFEGPPNAVRRVLEQAGSSDCWPLLEGSKFSNREVVSQASPSSEPVDILVVFSPEVTRSFGGTAATTAAVSSAVSYLNTALASTGSWARVRLVAAVEVPWVENGSTALSLTELTSGVSPAALKVRELREQHGADLVNLWIANTVDGTSGKAWLTGLHESQSAFGYSVIRVNDGPAYRERAFAHEIGHNLGCGHSRVDPAPEGIFPFAHGYRDVGVSPSPIDIMAYPCPTCHWHDVFSNPSVLISGRPLGRGASATDSADCNATFSYSASVVARYRRALTTVTPDTSPPFGALDSPNNNAVGLTGQVGVTGWALDDRGVKKVEIWRSPSGTDQPQVYIGDAVFVEGSRTDIAQRYPNFPNAARGGWGYALLSFGLPDRGYNSNLRLHAYAEDEAGNRARLGFVDVNFDNGLRIQPFGTIDSPAAGESVDGSKLYEIRGWALAMPGRRVADVNKFSLLVNGQPVPASFTLGLSRPDVALTFPNHSDSALSGFKVTLDARTLPAGPNQVAVVVEDDSNRRDGIGSRWVTVSRPSGLAEYAVSPVATEIPDGPILSGRSEVVEAPVLTVGFEQARSLLPVENGTIRIEGNSLINVDSKFIVRQVAVDGLLGLPVGASVRGSLFRWHIPLGFRGRRELELRGEVGEKLTLQLDLR